MLSRETTDTVIIGAGVIGLAIARELAASRSVVLLEQESRFGEHLSSRNSEVIHAGLYYPQDSLKARLCLRGNALLYQYCQEQQIPYQQCGKLIVANAGQQNTLEQLHHNALNSGATGLHRCSQQWLQQQEPWLQASEALLSEHSGILDSHALMSRLAQEAERNDALLCYRHRVRRIDCEPGDFLLQVESDDTAFELRCRHMINAAGLHAVPLLKRCNGFPAEKIPEQRLARGNYFSLSGRSPTQRLIYPLPEADGLGIHLTVDLAGNARFGPDVEWIKHSDYQVNSARLPQFEEAIQRYWPSLNPDRLSPAYAGIRPKLFMGGEPYRDFLIQGEKEHGITGMTNLLGIESPGLTAALAIAEDIAKYG
ncbi:MAG: NAD(P)/FAD-dependent oxidoreductase [Alcanivorax sp.]|uniref:NAD(P)/FAD-dependent oxidoreductase n=1 Tax=Alcanivorax sp. TaxID=1872427 RepID=UPI003DA6D831